MISSLNLDAEALWAAWLIVCLSCVSAFTLLMESCAEFSVRFIVVFNCFISACFDDIYIPIGKSLQLYLAVAIKLKDASTRNEAE